MEGKTGAAIPPLTVSRGTNGHLHADAFVERNSKMLRYDIAAPRDINSLRNWVDNKGSPSDAKQSISVVAAMVS